MRKAAWMLCVLPMFAGCVVIDDRVPVEMVTMDQSQPLGKEKSLQSTIRFDIGTLEITGNETGASLYSLDLEYDKAGYTPDIHYDPAPAGAEGRFYFDLHSTHRTGIRRERHNNHLRLAFTDSLPLSLRITAGVGDARLSLSRMKLAQIEFESGVGAAKISAYEPNPISCERIRLKSGVGKVEAIGLGNLNFREFEFEGGVGGADLDLTGAWRQGADVRLQIGVGAVTVRLPREIGVRVEAERHFLSGLQLEGFNQRDSFYYSENYDKAAVRVFIRVATGIGGLRISWV